MAFYYLLLGHLMGDFVLQTDKIAENKGKQWQWNLVHVLIVTLSIAVFSFSFGVPLAILVLVNGVIHFIMDYYKEEICKSLHISELSGFIIDQALHIILLYIISQAAVYRNNQLIDFTTVRLLIPLVMATFFAAVFTQFVLAALFPRLDNNFFKEGEKYIGIFTRVYSAVVFYLSCLQSPYYLLLLVIVPAMFFMRFRLGWNKWMSPSHLVVKLLLDTVVSAFCIIPIILLSY